MRSSQYDRRHPRSTAGTGFRPGVATIRTVLSFLLLVGGLCSCTLPDRRVDAALRQRAASQTQGIDRLDLGARATAEPQTVQDEVDRFALDHRAQLAEPVPERLPLSVSDARLRALANNLDLQVAFVDPALARTKVGEEEAKFDATIYGGARFKREDLPEIDSDLVSFTSDTKEVDKAIAKLTEIEQRKEALELDVGIKVPLPTGGAVKVENTFSEKNTIEPQRFEQNISALKFSLSQPLLRNAGIDANLASIRVARLGSGVARTKTKLAAIRILAAAEKAYWRVYAAQEVLRVRTQQYELAYTNLEFVRKRVAAGESAGIEVIRAEVGVVARLEALIIARTAYRLQQRELKRILNIANVGLDTETRIETTTLPQLLRFELDAVELVQYALDNRMEMLELELKLAADAIRVDFARNQALPLFVVDFEYGVLDRRGSFGTAWDDMWDFDKDAFAVGVRGEIPVTNEARRSRLRRAILTRAQRLASQQKRALAIRQEVRDALDTLNQNWQRILAARQNVVVSGVNYEAELKQFREGLRTMREVNEALTLLGEAQLKEINAILVYQVAQIDLAFATGTLLGYAKLELANISISDALDRPLPEAR